MNMPEQIWKPISGHDGYEVSSDGCVRSFWTSTGRSGANGPNRAKAKHPVIMKHYADSQGYLKVNLGIGKARRPVSVHRLVLIAFRGPPSSERPYCAHGNGNKKDNRIDNLRWANHDENAADRIVHGTWARGEKQGSSKLKETDVRKIREQLSVGVSDRKIAKCFGVNRSTIAHIRTRKTWLSV